MEEGTKNGNDRMKCPIQSRPYHSKKKDYASVSMILIFREPSSVLISHPPPSRTVLSLSSTCNLFIIQFSRWLEKLLMHSNRADFKAMEASPWLAWNLRTLPGLRRSVPLCSYILDFVLSFKQYWSLCSEILLMYTNLSFSCKPCVPQLKNEVSILLILSLACFRLL